MSLMTALAQSIDRLGGRRLVAAGASLAYGLTRRGQRFGVDSEGRWVNQQPEATIVSPAIHTTAYAAYRDWVIDHWAWGYRPRGGDTVIDLGAGVGEEAVIFSSLVGSSGRVISIEAQPETFVCLEETARRSGLTNVDCLCLAVDAADGQAKIAAMDNHLTSSIVAGAQGTTVPARSLDSLGEQFGWGEVALIKMNIEGAERGAVEGMTALTARTRNVVISCHDFLAERGGDDRLRTREDVRRALKGMGFQLTTRPDHPLPWVRDYLYGRRD